MDTERQGFKELDGPLTKTFLWLKPSRCMVSVPAEKKTKKEQAESNRRVETQSGEVSWRPSPVW